MRQVVNYLVIYCHHPGSALHSFGLKCNQQYYGLKKLSSVIFLITTNSYTLFSDVILLKLWQGHIQDVINQPSIISCFYFLIAGISLKKQLTMSLVEMCHMCWRR